MHAFSTMLQLQPNFQLQLRIFHFISGCQETNCEQSCTPYLEFTEAWKNLTGKC